MISCRHAERRLPDGSVVDIRGRSQSTRLNNRQKWPPYPGRNAMKTSRRTLLKNSAAAAGQYFMYLNPETVSGIAVSQQIVFAVIAGGVYSLLGPTVGSLLTLSLTEGLRVWFGTNFIGAANTIYGILLILCII